MTIMNQTLATTLAAALMITAPALAQTCNDHMPASAPDSRYTNNGNGTVTDNETGLMWKRCVEGLSGADCTEGSVQSFAWQQALQRGRDLDFAGYTDWRLPNVKELSSLVERRCYAPPINTNLFPNTPSMWFWSSSPSTNDFYADNNPRQVFVVIFGFLDPNDANYGNDGVATNDDAYKYYAVRLVRGGQ